MNDVATRRVASTDGVAVVVHHLVGRPGAEPLLIVHATGFNALAYGPVAAALGDRFDASACDVRGHGATAAPSGWPVDWDGFADDAEAAARASGTVGRPLWAFGHSMGGAALLIAARREPELFAGLVLFEPIVFPPMPASGGPNPLVEGARRRRARFDNLATARANYATKPPMNEFAADALDGYLTGGMAPIDDDVPDGEVALTCTPQFEAATFAAADEHGAWHELASIGVPTVVIGTPATNSNPPGAIAPLIAEQLTAARFVFRPDLDHFGPFSQPAVVAGLIVDAIDSFAGG